MYLLKHPDHYTSHKFRACYWRGYVYEVMQAWTDSENIAEKGKSTVVVALEDQNHTGQKRVVPVSPVLDYIWRPVEYENTCVYDWIRLNHKRLIPKAEEKSQSLSSLLKMMTVNLKILIMLMNRYQPWTIINWTVIVMKFKGQR